MSKYQLSPVVLKKLKEMDLDAEEVIRKALSIKAEGFDAGFEVHLPEGTRFMVWYKDRPFGGVIKAGKMVMEGNSYDGIRAAAEAVTGRPTTNGWNFWRVALPNSDNFFPISDLRKDK